MQSWALSSLMYALPSPLRMYELEPDLYLKQKILPSRTNKHRCPILEGRVVNPGLPQFSSQSAALSPCILYQALIRPQIRKYIPLDHINIYYHILSSLNTECRRVGAGGGRKNSKLGNRHAHTHKYKHDEYYQRQRDEGDWRVQLNRSGAAHAKEELRYTEIVDRLGDTEEGGHDHHTAAGALEEGLESLSLEGFPALSTIARLIVGCRILGPFIIFILFVLLKSFQQLVLYGHLQGSQRP